MKNLKNTLVALTMILMATFSLTAQTVDNFKIEHNPTSLSGKIHLVNTPDCRFDTLLPLMQPLGNTNKLVNFSLNSNTFVTINDTIPNRHGIYDTIATINFIVTENTVLQSLNGVDFDVMYKKIDNQLNSTLTDYYLATLNFSDFIMSPTYLPCYVSVGPALSTPTIKWESIENNAIEKYIIKRNGQNIDTVCFSSGILSYTDVNNHEAINYMQTYTLEAIDSTGRSRSGDATTIHARNLASVNGNVELDWNIPTIAGTITSFDIYEYDATLDVLTLVNTVPSTITQYTVINPDVTKTYIVGVSNVDCSGSATRSASTSLLSNPVQATVSAGIQSLIIDRNDEVIGYYDLMGKEIDANTSNQVVIVRYKSGKTVKLKK